MLILMQLALRSTVRLLKRPWLVYLLTCVAVAVLVFSRAHQWDRAIQAFDKAFQPKGSPPLPKDGNNRFFLDNDPYYWITYARQMVKTGQWRVRYTYVDNVPYGREVHWSQSVSWMLVAFGYVRHLSTGEPMHDAIEGASIWVNPFLLVLFAVGFSWLISRRMGVVAGAFFMLTFVTLPDVHWAFHPFHPGHHGFHVAFSLGAVLCLVLGGLGWVTRRGTEALEGGVGRRLRFFRPLQLMGRVEARRYFAAAGIFTGLGLWIGATVQFFSIGALAAGVVLVAFFMPAHLTSQEADYVPELWRSWGIWASMVGMAFYWVEYFPSHLAMRLEANNPVYIIAVVCIGELIVQLTRWRLGSWRAGFFGCLKIVMLAAGAALVPLLFAFGPVQWHNLRDLQMARLHQFIVEFYTYQKFSPNAPFSTWFVKYYGILPVFLAGALALSGSRRTKLQEWAALWISFWLCVFSLLLTLWQVRWAGLHAAMSVWLMIVVGHIAWRNVLSLPAARRPVGIAVFLSALVLGQAVFFTAREFLRLGHIRNGKRIEAQFVDAAMKKYLARGLRAESQGRPMRVICDPDIAPVLYYSGGIPAVTSYYWENVQGLHDATAFFTDRGDAVARRIAKERGLTQVIVPAGGRLQILFNFIETGQTSTANTPPPLATRLSSNTGGLPPWITLDKGLTRIGQQEFNLTTAQGVVSVAGRVTVYRLEPTEGVGPVERK
ncbi:MAG: hypothetical protein ABSD58_04380 [Verrucomicrobiia bacterium]|jgi:hypothetical protein